MHTFLNGGGLNPQPPPPPLATPLLAVVLLITMLQATVWGIGVGDGNREGHMPPKIRGKYFRAIIM